MSIGRIRLIAGAVIVAIMIVAIVTRSRSLPRFLWEIRWLGFRT